MKRYLSIALVALALAFLLLGRVGAQGNSYELGGVITGGSSALSGGAYTMEATLGQATVRTLEGGSYTLGGGVFGGGDMSTSNANIYLPLVYR